MKISEGRVRLPAPFARKMLMVMKLWTLVMFVGALQVSAKSVGQRVSLNVSKSPLEAVFKNIEKQTGYTFLYDIFSIQEAKPITADFKNLSLASALAICFEDQAFTYRVVNRKIIVKSTMTAPSVTDALLPDTLSKITGSVVNEKNEPLAGVTITVKGTNIKALTAEDGRFTINAAPSAALVFGFIGYKTKEITLKGGSVLSVSLELEARELNEIKIGSTGYQYIPKERATGSFDYVDNQLLNRSVSQNILDRIENLTPGVLFDRSPKAPDPLLIRGRGTIYANAAPLIVMDNFAYDGDVNNINPNDIESVTVLKDAAAASIWGARAGNGVIVITTKKGVGEKPTIRFNSNVNFGQRPDLGNLNRISSSDAIEVEKWLFSKGYYNSDLTSVFFRPISPVVELLDKIRSKSIDSLQAASQIEALKANNVYKEQEEFLYQGSLNQQYAVNVGGNSKYTRYYFSAGYDKNRASLVGNGSDRVSLRSVVTFRFSDALESNFSLNYTSSSVNNGGNPGAFIGGVKQIYPYATLVLPNGNPASVGLTYRQSFLDNAKANGLADWNYYPLAEIGAIQSTQRTKDIVINTSLKYKILEGVFVESKYQHENSGVQGRVNYGEQSYFTRDLINSYYQPTAINKFPIPQGAILDNEQRNLSSHQGRIQLSVDRRIADHSVNIIAGWEVRNLITTSSNNRAYGFRADRSTINSNLNFNTDYAMYYNSGVAQKISNVNNVSRMTDNFLSTFFNGSYAYKERYILSASARKDEANLFGVNSNQKGAPLWSLGGSWILSKEEFFKSSMMNYLKLRFTYGKSGNISRLASAYTTASSSVSYYNSLQSSTIVNPPNANLRWEKITTLNLGLDFESVKGIVSGTIEFYKKRSSDLMGQAPLDPTYGLGSNSTGLSFFYGNVAAMKGSGFDLQLNTKNLQGTIKWNTTLIYSFAKSKVSEYLLPVSQTGSLYLSERTINPIVGRPVFSVFSYAWAGLSSSTGDPQGVINKSASTDYLKILAQPLDSLVYSGNVQPQGFGALRNTFSYKSISVSFSISIKNGYFFRKQSIDYSALYSSWNGNGDYAKRWVQPGDEQYTYVPSQVYTNSPQFSNRNLFYSTSQVLVRNGSHIRFDDVNLTYTLSNKMLKSTAFQSVQIYLYASNLGLLWTSDKEGVDPLYQGSIREKSRAAVGLNVSF